MRAKNRHVEEILIPKDAAEARRLQRYVQKGTLIRIAPGVFVPAMPEGEVAHLVRRNWQHIAGHLVPGAVVSHLSAFLGGLTPDNQLVLSHPTRFNRTIALPGMAIVLMHGPGHLAGDMALASTGLAWASRPRMLLENLGVVRGAHVRKAGRDQVENKLVDFLNASGESALNQIRDSARALATALSAEKEFIQLDAMIGALLGTHARGKLRTKAGQLVAQGIPVDKERMERFELLASHLRGAALPVIQDVAAEGEAKVHFAFLESYFSNYVEGTKLSISEAEDIVLRNQISPQRPKDSHDVLGVFRLAMAAGTRDSIPPPGPPFVAGLQDRHKSVMAERPDVYPGELKLEQNYAGTTVFVAPSLVRGTLQEASALATSVPEGLARAIYYEFMISDIHPFNDGNGRISRLLMNAELSRLGLCRVIIPTLYHPQYVDCKKQLTQANTPEAYVRAIALMARWTAQFGYSDLPQLIKHLQACNAMEESPVKFHLLNIDQSRAA